MKFAKKIKILVLLVIFGVSFCFADDEGLVLSVSENSQLAMSMPAYPVTAGDVYTLAFNVSSTGVTYSIPVDLSYKIRVANLGTIDCSGMTYIQLKEAVINLVQRNYPMSGVQFILSTPATFNVTVSGEVNNAVEKKVWSLTRLSSLVTENSTAYSSTRNVTVISSSGKKRNYDLFLASRNGDLSQNPYLRPGDKIIINRVERKVTINGAVERPGTYELLEKENIQELINKYASGLTEYSDLSRIELIRYKDNDDFFVGAGKTFYIEENDVKNNLELNNLDVITISSYADIKKTIFFEGAVGVTQTTSLQGSNKIAINFSDGENYASVVRKNSQYFSTVSDLENAFIIRHELKNDGTLEQKQIPINLSRVLYDATYFTEETLQNLDVLSVPFNQMFVNVTGAVMSPGRYPYIAGRNWEYYIKAAGGFNFDKNTNSKIKITSPTGKKMSKNDVILPETNIRAMENNVKHNWDKYNPSFAALISLVSACIGLFVTIRSL